jgi:hypothetical protein
VKIIVIIRFCLILPLMFSYQGQTKKNKATTAKMKESRDQLKNVNITDTVEGAVRKDQFNRERDEKATRTTTKNDSHSVNVNETVETNERKVHHDRDKAEKGAQLLTRANLKNVNITDTVEGDVRKEQHHREQDWKAAGKQSKEDNTNFDMARALFN